MSSEPSPARRPIAGVRISTVALVGIVAAIAVPAGAVALVTSGSLDNHQKQQTLSQAAPVTKVVVVDQDSTVRITGDPAVAGVTGQATLTWHTFSGSKNVHVNQQYADGVLTLTKDCSGGACGADIDIRVPPTASVQVDTTNAGITVANVSGTVNLHTENASITANQLGGGDATLKTSNSPIRASFAGAPKNIWAHTSNNYIRIATDGRTKYYDNVSASNGTTTTHNDQDRFADNVIDAETSNGDITIE